MMLGAARRSVISPVFSIDGLRGSIKKLGGASGEARGQTGLDAGSRANSKALATPASSKKTGFAGDAHPRRRRLYDQSKSVLAKDTSTLEYLYYEYRLGGFSAAAS